MLVYECILAEWMENGLFLSGFRRFWGRSTPHVTRREYWISDGIQPYGGYSLAVPIARRQNESDGGIDV